MFQTPILLMVFNRPEKTRRLLKQLSKIKPYHIYVGADGPRSESEQAKTDEVRAIIEQELTWPCEVRQLYRERNLGCRGACSSAISWFFEQVERGIILEDDIDPSLAFFRYCEELLDYHEESEQVLHISGYQAHGSPDASDSYFYSSFPRVWGWATWRRAWKKYNDDLPPLADWSQSTAFGEAVENPYFRAFWQLIIEKVQLPNSRLRNSSWAYFWALSIAREKGFCATPVVTTVQNIGFDAEATHTKKVIASHSQSELGFPLAHPKSLAINQQKDWEFFRYQLVDTNWKFFKVVLKRFLPFLKPLS